MNADGGALHIQTVGRNIRVSDAGQIGRDYGETLGQSGNDRLPHQRGLRIAMQQDERGAVAGGHVVQLGSVNLCTARGDSFILCNHCCLRRESSVEKEKGEHS